MTAVGHDVCIFNSEGAQLVADVEGYFPLTEEPRLEEAAPLSQREDDPRARRSDDCSAGSDSRKLLARPSLPR